MMTIEDMFGDLKKIDILAEKSETKEVLMVLVCNGFIDGSPQTQKALMDKMEGYLNHTQSEVFQAEYADWSVILRVTFDEEPDQLILALLNKCYPWADDYAVNLEFEIGGKQVRFVEQSCHLYERKNYNDRISQTRTNHTVGKWYFNIRWRKNHGTSGTDHGNHGETGRV